MEVRTAYLREYPNRTFSAVDENNDVYDKLYKELSSDHMEMYREKAAKQAKQQWNISKMTLYTRFEAQSGKLISAGTN